MSSFGFGITPAPWETEVYRRNPRFYAFEVVPTIKQQSAGTTITLQVPTIDLNLGVAAVNKELEVGESDPVNVLGSGQANKLFWNRPQIVSVLMAIRTVGTGNHERCGVELGTYGVPPPFPTPPARNLIQLVAHFDAVGGDHWELLVGNPGGQTLVPYFTTAPVQNNAYHLLFVYQPGQYVRGFVDGVLIGESTTNLPSQGVSELDYAGILANSGTIAGTVRATFATLRAETIGAP